MHFIYPALEPGNLLFQRCQHAIQAGLACFSELLALLLENPVGQIFELLLQGVAGFFDEILLFGDDLFLLLVPFGVLFEFDMIGLELVEAYPIVGSHFVWLSVPFSALVMWVFHTTERIGRVSENPFEGSANDVPITTMARGIEIDLRQMIDDDPESIPPPIEIKHGTQT